MNKHLLLLIITALLPLSTYAQKPASRNFVAHLSGDQEVPLVESGATGQAIFQVTGEGGFLAFRLNVANIHNVVASHIHLAPAGSNGAVVAFLYGPEISGGGRTQGVLNEGLLESADLVGPLAGQDISVLIEALRTGGAYVNVHTNDGIGSPNTGPGDIASGEIRGQIRPAGPR